MYRYDSMVNDIGIHFLEEKLSAFTARCSDVTKKLAD
jgi:hypothetical protein